MKKLVKEFKDFIMRGNVLDMAVGVIIATAFGKITSSLVNDLLMPFIGWIVGARDMTALNIVVREAVMDGDTVVAPPRMLIAFLENNLQADGSVKIPAVLRPYMGGTEVLIPKK